MPRPNSRPAASPVSKFTLATNRRWKDQQSGEWKEETDWHNIVDVAQRRTSPTTCSRASRSTWKAVCETRSYEDKEGQKKYITEVVCEAQNLILLGGGGGRDGPPEGARRL